MYLPQINEISQNRDVIDVFGGYNHSMTVRDGEFYEMTNLTSDDYPAVSVRKKRKFGTVCMPRAGPSRGKS